MCGSGNNFIIIVYSNNELGLEIYNYLLFYYL